MASDQTRIYKRTESAVFSKTKEAFGGLSNMAAGFPVRVNGMRILTSEALYQACRFPHLPDIQRLIIEQPSPMTAKMKSKPYRKDSRPDWDQVRVKIMRWCLRVKLVQNWRQFSELLLTTGDKPIVEESRKDDFWGAKPVDDHTLVGMNVLGRLLMELREEFKSDRRDALLRVEPLPIPDFLLNGQPIETIVASAMESKFLSAAGGTQTPPGAPRTEQASLFDQPSLFDQGVQELEQPEYKLDTPARDIQADKEAMEKRAMAADLKPYAEYKETGVPWLGKIPAHWSIGPGFAAFREKQVKNIGMAEKQVLSLSYGRIVIKPMEKLHGLVPDSFDTYQIVDPGDIIIRSTDLQNDWKSLRVGLVRNRGIITSAYLCFKTTDALISEYGYQLLHTLDLMKVFYGMGSGLRQNLSFLDFKRTPIFVPPLDEQAVIVRFLDHANRRLERTIRAKRKVIALLNEQRQAITHRAVIRGLDPSIPLKPSGIPWLGDIPQHWEVRPLKSVCKIQSGITLGKDYAGQTINEYPYLRVANVQAGHVNLTIVKTIRVTNAEALRCMLQKGDVLMTEGGDPDKLGRGCVWDAQVNPCLHQNHVFAVRPNQSQLEPHFLSVLMGTRYVRAYFESTAKQTTNLASTNKTKIGQLQVLLPKVGEQQRILTALNEEARPLNVAISRLEREIELLREYRTCLVADVVTGKLDVREAARQLPAESEEPEASPEPDADDTEELEPLSTEDA